MHSLASLFSVLLASLLLLLLAAPRAALALVSSSSYSSSCNGSIFDFSAPYYELAPNEAGSRLMAPQTHPRGSKVCGAMAGQKSCCSDKTLTDFIRWADALDAYTALSKYITYYVQTDPRLLVDNLIVYIRAISGEATVDWVGIRTQTRDAWGKVAFSLLDALIVPADKIWGSIVTYQEGLLCSSCVPDFAPNFLNPTAHTVTLKPDAANAVADAVLNLLATWDHWWKAVENINLVAVAAGKLVFLPCYTHTFSCLFIA